MAIHSFTNNKLKITNTSQAFTTTSLGVVVSALIDPPEPKSDRFQVSGVNLEEAY